MRVLSFLTHESSLSAPTHLPRWPDRDGLDHGDHHGQPGHLPVIAATPFVSSFPGLAALNFLSGVIGAVIPSALSTRMAGETPPEHLVAAMGGLNASADVGFFVGPVVGGLLAGLSLAWAFLLAIPVTVLTLLLLRGYGAAAAVAEPGGD